MKGASLANSGRELYARGLLLILALLLCGGMLSCMKKNANNEPESKYRFALSFDKGKETAYDVGIRGSAKIHLDNPDPKKREIIEEKMEIQGEMIFTGAGSKTSQISWKVFRNNDPNEFSLIPSAQNMTIDERGTVTGPNQQGYQRMFNLLFHLPNGPLNAGKQWESSLRDGEGTDGFIRSKITGEQEMEGIPCYIIETDFDMYTKKGRNLLKIKGNGISYFSGTKGAFVSVQRAFTLSSFIDKPGSKSVRMENKGEVTMHLKNQASTQGNPLRVK